MNTKKIEKKISRFIDDLDLKTMGIISFESLLGMVIPSVMLYVILTLRKGS